MDSIEFRSWLSEENFEQFCDEAISQKILSEIKGTNYRPRHTDTGYPYDAECVGEIDGERGKILFELKGPGPQTSDRDARKGFHEDLCGRGTSLGKLVRAAKLCPQGKALCSRNERSLDRAI